MFEVAQMISLLIGGAVAHSAVAVRMAHGTVAKTTEKAVLITFDNGSLWLPKKSLVKSKVTDTYKLAHWFTPSSQQWSVIEKNSRINQISVA